MKAQKKIMGRLLPALLILSLFIAGCCNKEKEEIKTLQNESAQLKMTNDSLQIIINKLNSDSGSLAGLMPVDTTQAYEIIQRYHPKNAKEAIKSLDLYYPQIKSLIDKYGSHFYVHLGLDKNKEATYVIGIFDSKANLFRYFTFDPDKIKKEYSDRNGRVLFYAPPCRCGVNCVCPPQPKCMCNCNC